jgi:hypothetical protein
MEEFTPLYPIDGIEIMTMGYAYLVEEAVSQLA